MLVSRRAAIVLLLLLAGFEVGSAQEPSPPASGAPAAATPTFREQINFVRVDVIVTDGTQKPVTDLTKADFEVLEDGKPQSVEQFRLIKIDGNPAPGEKVREIRNRDDEEAEAAKEGVRLFLFFFDDYHVRMGSAASLRDPLIKFIQTQLRPTDMVAVMYPLTPVDGISFTRNFGSIESAVRGFEGRKFRYEPRNQFEAEYSRYPTETIETIRNQVVMGALRGAATRLGSLREGRKSIIFVSEGFTAMLPAQMRNQDASLPCTGPGGGGIPGCNPAAGNPMAGEQLSSRESTAQYFAQTDIYSRLREVYDVANRNNTAIYSLDPRGLATQEFDIDENIGPNQNRAALQMTQDTLRVLSQETDGRAIVNRNDLTTGLAQVTRDASAYYLIGYTSSAAPTDGKFHEIKVRVKRRGIDVRARKGYWAATVADTIKATAPPPQAPKAVEAALASISTSIQSGKYVRTWVGTERGANGKTRVTFLWEPLPPLPGVRRDPAGRIALIAATTAGDLIYRGRSPDAATPLAPAGTATATGPQRVSFDAAPGAIELRMTVEGADGGGVLDQEVQKITIPDFTSPDSVMSTARVHRARNAREVQLLAADAAAVPAVVREFSRTERLLVRFDVYGGAVPSAVLLNRAGTKMADLTVAPATAGGTHQIDMGLNTIPSGEYLIEITAKGTAGEVKQLIALRVAG